MVRVRARPPLVFSATYDVGSRRFPSQPAPSPFIRGHPPPRAPQIALPPHTDDRHRGGGRPPTPATPPCVRVRTRRFESVTLTFLEQ